jgi:glutathione synthase/RimK-type ligase-like ATP-grasp enzyme
MKETRMADVRFCPTQFQGYVAGTDVRVHVVGDAVFACEVSSTATDYRYPGDADVARKAIELPKEIAERCRAVTKQLGLVVAGIDLRRAKQDWVCFEVNPSPAFTYFDLDGAIAIAIAKLLGGKS